MWPVVNSEQIWWNGASICWWTSSTIFPAPFSRPCLKVPKEWLTPKKSHQRRPLSIGTGASRKLIVFNGLFRKILACERGGKIWWWDWTDSWIPTWFRPCGLMNCVQSRVFQCVANCIFIRNGMCCLCVARMDGWGCAAWASRTGARWRPRTFLMVFCRMAKRASVTSNVIGRNELFVELKERKKKTGHARRNLKIGLISFQIEWTFKSEAILNLEKFKTLDVT